MSIYDLNSGRLNWSIGKRAKTKTRRHFQTAILAVCIGRFHDHAAGRAHRQRFDAESCDRCSTRVLFGRYGGFHCVAVDARMLASGLCIFSRCSADRADHPYPYIQFAAVVIHNV